MAKHVNLAPTKTYANEANAHAAVKRFGYDDDIRYFVQMAFVPGYVRPRFFPVFIGESAVQAGVHFNFHVIN